VIIAETIDWNTTARVGNHHYAARFLERGVQVLWMSQYLHPLSLITGERERTLRALKFWRGAAQAQNPGLVLYTPFTLLPCRPYRMLDGEAIAWRSLRATVPPLRSILRRLGFDRPDVLWISNPLLAGLADLTSYGVFVLRIKDRYSAFGNMPRCAEALERVLIERADIVYATSRALMTGIEPIGKKVVYLPNGVDFAHFHKPAGMPGEYRHIASPRVLYSGAIEDWFDVELLAAVARGLPGVSFVLVGSHRHIDLGELAGLENVHLLGPRPYADLAGYYQHADAAVIPFKINRLTEAVNPIKLYEYFAAGLPTISTPLPEVKQFEPLVKIAKGHEEFAAAVREAVQEGGDALLEDRLQCARSNSWDGRFEEVWNHIGDVRQRKTCLTGAQV